MILDSFFIVLSLAEHQNVVDEDDDTFKVPQCLEHPALVLLACWRYPKWHPKPAVAAKGSVEGGQKTAFVAQLDLPITVAGVESGEDLGFVQIGNYLIERWEGIVGSFQVFIQVSWVYTNTQFSVFLLYDDQTRNPVSWFLNRRNNLILDQIIERFFESIFKGKWDSSRGMDWRDGVFLEG